MAKATVRERPLLADCRRPTFGSSPPKPAGQDMGLNVSNVGSISSTGAPGIGYNRSFPDALSIPVKERLQTTGFRRRI